MKFITHRKVHAAPTMMRQGNQATIEKHCCLKHDFVSQANQRHPHCPLEHNATAMCLAFFQVFPSHRNSCASSPVWPNGRMSAALHRCSNSRNGCKASLHVLFTNLQASCPLCVLHLSSSSLGSSRSLETRLPALPQVRLEACTSQARGRRNAQNQESPIQFQVAAVGVDIEPYRGRHRSFVFAIYSIRQYH